jgi:hypothetical protein
MILQFFSNNDTKLSDVYSLCMSKMNVDNIFKIKDIKRTDNILNLYNGIQIIEDKYMPKNKIIAFDRENKIIGMITLQQ